ncbi:MAG: hypothetical protein ACOX50_02285 [Patescibacteria group bacterium]|jgi:hypothetical protein
MTEHDQQKERLLTPDQATEMVVVGYTEVIDNQFPGLMQIEGVKPSYIRAIQIHPKGKPEAVSASMAIEVTAGGLVAITENQILRAARSCGYIAKNATVEQSKDSMKRWLETIEGSIKKQSTAKQGSLKDSLHAVSVAWKNLASLANPDLAVSLPILPATQDKPERFDFLAENDLLQGLSPERAARAVFEGYTNDVNNKLSPLAKIIPLELTSLLCPARLPEEIVNPIETDPEKVVKQTAVFLKNRISENIRSYFDLPENQKNPERTWFQEIETKIESSQADEPAKERMLEKIREVKNAWQNLIDLSDSQKEIKLPLSHPTTGTLLFNFFAAVECGQR